MTTSSEEKQVDAPANRTGMSRGQFVVTAAGSAVVGAIGVGAYALPKVVAYELEIQKLRALVALYEQLDKIGLDAILGTAMSAVRAALETLKAGVRTLRAGVDAVEAAIKNFQSALDSLRNAANGISILLGDLQQKARSAEGPIVAVIGVALPLAESIRGFFSTLLSKVPLPIPNEFTRTADALVDLIRTTPTTIETISSRLLAPLRDLFFPISGNASIKTNLFDPITKNILDPLKNFLNDVEKLLDTWEKSFTAPVTDALDQRRKVRAQIADYRRQNSV